MSAQQMRSPTAAGVARAAAKIADLLPMTPLLEAEVEGVTMWFKAESLQPVGAFKIRGAWHRLSDLSPEERARGVVGVSSGNHAQGVAWAAKRLGIHARMVMPNDAPQIKVEATLDHGAEIVFYDRPGGEDRDALAARLVEESGATLVHAYADPWVIEGQGSIGLEIASQLAARGVPGPTRLVCPLGGGGLTAGLALPVPRLKSCRSNRKVGMTSGSALSAARSSGWQTFPRRRPAMRCKRRPPGRSTLP